MDSSNSTFWAWDATATANNPDACRSWPTLAYDTVVAYAMAMDIGLDTRNSC